MLVPTGAIILAVSALVWQPPFEITPGMLQPRSDLMPGALAWACLVRASPEHVVPLAVHVTFRGNGSLATPGLSLSVVDRHHDTVSYRNGMLRVLIADEDHDDLTEIHVSGVVEFRGEKHDELLEEEPIAGVFEFDAECMDWIRIGGSMVSDPATEFYVLTELGVGASR